MLYRLSRVSSTWVLCSVSYVAAVGALACINTCYLGLGDPIWGRSGWQYYWPFWALAFAPSMAYVIMETARLEGLGVSACYYLGFLMVSLALIEVFFFVDLHWLVLVAEETVLVGSAFLCSRLIGRPRSIHLP